MSLNLNAFSPFSQLMASTLQRCFQNQTHKAVLTAAMLSRCPALRGRLAGLRPRRIARGISTSLHMHPVTAASSAGVHSFDNAVEAYVCQRGDALGALVAAGSDTPLAVALRLALGNFLCADESALKASRLALRSAMADASRRVTLRERSIIDGGSLPRFVATCWLVSKCLGLQRYMPWTLGTCATPPPFSRALSSSTALPMRSSSGSSTTFTRRSGTLCRCVGVWLGPSR